VPSHHLEDRIRNLCTEAVASDDTQFPNAMEELRSALREHIEHVRKLAAKQLSGERDGAF